MAYATQNDIIEAYGIDALHVADRDGDGETDVSAVDFALNSASAEIDTYIGVRYSLPFDVAPPFLTQLCVDIALYRMAASQAMVSEEHRTRYEDAIGALKRLAKGDAKLVLPVVAGSGDDDIGTSIEGPNPIVQSGPERLFTREKLRDM